jgi:hypothetical protein
VARSERARVSVARLEGMQQEYNETVANITKFNNLCEYSKEELKGYLMKKNIEIEERLPAMIDKSIQEISGRNAMYNKAYLEMLEVSKKLADVVQTEKVIDYIKKEE